MSRAQNPTSGFRITAANFFTILRILAMPAIFLLVLKSGGASNAAFAVFLAAALTDLIDGNLARLTGSVSELGKSLDPVADQILIGGTVIALTITGRLPLPGIVIIAARDIFLIAGYKLFKRRGVVIRVSKLGKSYTVVLLLAVIASLASIGAQHWYAAIFGIWPWLFWAGVAGSLLTGIAYIAKAFHELKPKLDFGH